jgi:hypothetical protein
MKSTHFLVLGLFFLSLTAQLASAEIALGPGPGPIPVTPTACLTDGFGLCMNGGSFCRTSTGKNGVCQSSAKLGCICIATRDLIQGYQFLSPSEIDDLLFLLEKNK